MFVKVATGSAYQELIKVGEILLRYKISVCVYHAMEYAVAPKSYNYFLRVLLY